jgi:hypothetical protein
VISSLSAALNLPWECALFPRDSHGKVKLSWPGKESIRDDHRCLATPETPQLGKPGVHGTVDFFEQVSRSAERLLEIVTGDHEPREFAKGTFASFVDREFHAFL